MKKILKKLSGLIFILFIVAVLGVYSYVQENPSILVSANILSRHKDWLGNKEE